MNYSEVAKVVGHEAFWSAGGLSIRVKVLDVKFAYGRTRYRIQPIAGSGTTWTEQIRPVCPVENGEVK